MVANTSKIILKRLKDSQISKPMDYNKLINIENNPNDNIDQRIILLQSLIKESKDRMLVSSKRILFCQKWGISGFFCDYDYLFRFDKNADGTINFAYIIRKSKFPESYEELNKDYFIIRYRNI